MKNKFDVFFWIGLTYTSIPVFLVVIASSILIGVFSIKDIKPKGDKKEIYVEPQQPVVVGEVKTKEVITTPKPVIVITPKPKVTVEDTVKLPTQVVDSTNKSE